MTTHQRILEFLNHSNINYQEYSHPPSATCELAAQNRGIDLRVGGKTLLMKAKNTFHLFVISGALKADNNKIRKILNTSKLRFATDQELMDHCGVVSGALPPFGKDFYPYDLYVDESIVENKLIAFNSGILEHSIVMDVKDYLDLMDPTICQFRK